MTIDLAVARNSINFKYIQVGLEKKCFGDLFLMEMTLALAIFRFREKIYDKENLVENN